ncbi:helix-turn-helix transcriptional regulator [Frondihabitans peucedani]|uniref:HTH cro/C1-type domain-containing protein n=1 Tax=Frondihabitans peucedani TaxID=598626 RepID=A0ABP8E4G7_9MICO
MDEASKTTRDAGPELEPLLREVLGRRLRELRLARGERLVETAARAGISPQYLSEVERGLKEPSSEMIAAITGALRITLVDLALGVVAELRGTGPVLDLGTVASAAPVADLAPPAAGFQLYAVAA